jgi:hypothetical protein
MIPDIPDELLWFRVMSILMFSVILIHVIEVHVVVTFGIHVDEGKGGNQKTKCPKCSHIRKNKTDPCLSVNTDDGIYFCHHCSWKGSISNGGNSGYDDCIIYDYCDEKGNVLYQKIRAYPKKFWQQTPDGGKLNGVKRVPYRLRELIESVGLVYISEGEKDFDTLFNLGLTATCNDSGAGNWRPEFNEIFHGTFIGSHRAKVSINELLDSYVDHLKIEEAKSIDRVMSGLKTVRK